MPFFCVVTPVWGGTLSEVFMIMNFTLTYRQTPFDAI